MIPPDGVDLDQEAYRAVMNLRDALERGELVAESVWERIDADPGDDRAFVDAVYETYIAGQTLSGRDESVVDEAMTALANGDRSQATSLLAERFTSVCETERPVGSGGTHSTACHLVEGAESARPERHGTN